MRRVPRSRSFPRLLALAFACALIVASLGAAPTKAQAEPYAPTQTAATTLDFADVSGMEWYAGAVYALASEGIVDRREDGSFGPDGNVTRAEMAVFLARALGLEESPGQPFFDVNASDRFAGAVGALFQRGLIQGTSLIMFSPEQVVSRQEAATLVMRSLAFLHRDDPRTAARLRLTEYQAPAWLAGFHDRQLIAPAHAVSVANAYRLAILDDPANGWFFPEGDLTRAEMAVILFRAFLQPVVPRATYPEELPAVSAYDSLSVGSKGPLVSFLEARLTALHYPCGPVDGTYDYRTKDAVMAFEKVERLKRNGKVNAEVWARLLSARTPTPRRSDIGTRCEVDIARQVLFMITDNKVSKVVHVSTGRRGTRMGHFAIQEKYKGWVEAITVSGRMYYPSYVVSKTAIHGFTSVPPYPASHGCVRVPVWITKELYYELPTGTVVDIYR